MWIRRREPKDELLVGYDREMLRSSFVSLFWAVISYKKERYGFALKTLADKIGVNKSSPSRWFSGERPNWTVNTIADIANALNVDIQIRATDRETGITFAPHGIISVPAETKGTILPSRDDVAKTPTDDGSVTTFELSAA